MQTTLLENLFSNTQEKGAPSVVSSRKPQPGTTRQDHHKQRTTKITCDSKITPEMRHKIVTNNGHLPKCVTSGLKAFRIHFSQAKICLHSAPEARCTSFTLLFLSPHPPTLFYYHNIHPGGSNIAVLQAKRTLERGRLYTVTDLGVFS